VKTGISLHTGSARESGMGLVYRGLCEMELGHLFPTELYEGTLEGGLLNWGPRRIYKVRLWKWTSLSIGAPLLGSMERGSFPRALERRENYSLFRKIFYEKFERYVKRVL